MPAPPLRRRMACWLYEGVLMFGVVVAAGLVFSIAAQMRHALEHRHAMQAFLFLVCGIYFCWFWSKGQTLAMKTWRIGITDRQGRPLTQARAAWRYLLCWLWFLPPLALSAPFHLPAAEVGVLTMGWIAVWALLSRFQPEGQFWHDVLAGTRLTDARAPKTPASPAPAANADAA